MTEEWRDVVGYEGRYLVSNMGRIKSLLFRSNGGEEIMKHGKNHAGYHVVTLGKSRKQFRVHALVLLAFVGPRPIKHQGCHNDNDKDNNRLDNLRWDTCKGNLKDRRSYVGSANPRSKLTEDERMEVGFIRASGMPTQAVAEAYGISAVRVSQLCWPDLTFPPINLWNAPRLSR